MLHRFLKYQDGHLCKNPPRDAAEFYVRCSDQYAPHFRGILTLNLEIVTAKPEEEEENSLHDCQISCQRQLCACTLR